MSKFLIVILAAFILITCDNTNNAGEERDLNSSDNVLDDNVTDNNVVDDSISDDYILGLAYDRNYKYPDGFYYEKDLTGSEYSVYYENTLSIKPVNEREDWIELHTLSREEARNWSNLSNEYSSVNRAIIRENETEKYFEFVRKNENEYYGNFLFLSRVHKSDYFIPMHDYLPAEHDETYIIGIFNGKLTTGNVKELIEYLWDYPNRQNNSSKVAKVEITEQEDKFEYYIQEIFITGGDWGVYDVIYIYDITFTLDKNTRVLSLTDKKLIKSIKGIKR